MTITQQLVERTKLLYPCAKQSCTRHAQKLDSPLPFQTNTTDQIEPLLHPSFAKPASDRQLSHEQLERSSKRNLCTKSAGRQTDSPSRNDCSLQTVKLSRKSHPFTKSHISKRLCSSNARAKRAQTTARSKQQSKTLAKERISYGKPSGGQLERLMPKLFKERISFA